MAERKLEDRVTSLEQKMFKLYDVVKAVQERNKELLSENRKLNDPLLVAGQQSRIIKTKVYHTKSYLHNLKKVDKLNEVNPEES